MRVVALHCGHWSERLGTPSQYPHHPARGQLLSPPVRVALETELRAFLYDASLAQLSSKLELPVLLPQSPGALGLQVHTIALAITIAIAIAVTLASYPRFADEHMGTRKGTSICLRPQHGTGAQLGFAARPMIPEEPGFFPELSPTPLLPTTVHHCVAPLCVPRVLVTTVDCEEIASERRRLLGGGTAH